MDDTGLSSLVQRFVEFLQSFRGCGFVTGGLRFTEGAFQAGDAYSDQPVVIAFAVALALEQCPAPCKALLRAAIFDSL